MKIVFAIDGLDGFGGAQRVASILCNNFCSDGNDVYLLSTGSNANSVYELDNRIVRIAFENKKGLSKIKAMNHFLKETKPDVVISFLTMVNIYVLLASKHVDSTFIISERNDPINCSFFEKKLMKLFYKKADALVVQTEAIKEKMKKYYKGEAYIIPNPIETKCCSKDSYIATNNVISVGRLTKQKNYFLMIDAFKIFLISKPFYSLHIYGDGPMKHEISKYITDNALQDSIVLQGTKSNILDIERNSDFYVMTSLYEGVPNSLAEAMSIGLPCISTIFAGGGAEDLIRDGINGVLTSFSPGDIARKMVELADNQDLRKTIGKNAQQLSVERSQSKIMALWYRIINEALKNCSLSQNK